MDIRILIFQNLYFVLKFLHMDKDSYPLHLWYDCEATNGGLKADIVEIAIRSGLFEEKVFRSFIFTNEKLSRFTKFNVFCNIFRKMKINVSKYDLKFAICGQRFGVRSPMLRICYVFLHLLSSTCSEKALSYYGEDPKECRPV